jgi:hypothetical protein
MVERLRSEQSIFEEKLPVPREATVTLEDSDQVPILPKVAIIGLQIFVTCMFYIFVNF